MNKKILGIGNAIVDVLAKVDDEFLIKRNFIKGSMKLINKSEYEDLKKNINNINSYIPERSRLAFLRYQTHFK